MKPYLVPFSTTITMHKMGRAAIVGVHTRSKSGFPSGLLEILKVSTSQIILALLRREAAECSRKFLYTVLRLTFVKLEYLMGWYALTIWDAEQVKWFNRVLLEYKPKDPAVICMDSFESYADKKSSLC